MEPAGLVVGGIGLAGLFSSCLEALERLDSWKNFDIDSRFLGSRFNAEKLRLKNWGELVGFERGELSQGYHEALDDLQIAPRIREHLSIITEICSKADHTFLPLKRPDDASAKLVLPPRGNIQNPSSNQYKSRTQRVKWALGDKAKCKEQVEFLGQLVQDLYDLVPPDGAKGTRTAHGTAGNDALESKSGTNTCHGLCSHNLTIFSDALAENGMRTAERRGVTDEEKRQIKGGFPTI